MSAPVSRSTSVLLIEPHKALALKFRDLLVTSLSTIPDIQMVDSLQDGLNFLSSHEISLTLLDLALPDSTGSDAVRRIRAATPRSAVIVFTESGNVDSLLEAVQAGAHEILPTLLPSPQTLALSIRTALMRACPSNMSPAALQSPSSITIALTPLPKLAHDLNNALTSINGFTDILLNRLQAEDPLRRCAEQIKDACDHAASLTKELGCWSTGAPS